MQEHCINALKHDTPGIISCGLCFGANQHTKITDLQNRSSRRWFVDGPRWQTKCLAASWSALIACETSCAFSSSKKCCRVTEWKRSEMLHFSRNVASLLILKISLEPQYLYNGFLHSKPTSVKTLSVTCQATKQFTGSGFTIFLSFCSSYNLSTSERDKGNFWCSCQSFVRSCESVTKDKKS